MHRPCQILLNSASFSPLAKQRRGLITYFLLHRKSWQVFRDVIKGSGSRRETGKFEKHCWGGCNRSLWACVKKKMYSGSMSGTRLQIYFAYSYKNAVRFGKHSIWAITILKQLFPSPCLYICILWHLYSDRFFLSFFWFCLLCFCTSN